MSGKAREPGGGWIDGKTHVFPIRVYYEDTDFSGVVYHASYLRFMERGRSEFLRMAGCGHRALLEAGQPLVWAVHRIEIDFLRPAKVEDALEVGTSVLALHGARMQLDQLVSKGRNVLAKAMVEVCVITLDGRPRRVPDAVRIELEPFLQSRKI